MRKLSAVFLAAALFAQGAFAESGFYISSEAVIAGQLDLPRGEEGIGPEHYEWYRGKAEMHSTSVWGKFVVNYDNSNFKDGGIFHSELAFTGLLRNQTDTSFPNPFENMARLNWYAHYDSSQFRIAVGIDSMENAFTSFLEHKPHPQYANAEVKKESFTYLYGWYYFWDQQIRFDIAYKGYDAALDPYLKNYSVDLPLASDIVSAWNLGISSYDLRLPWWGNLEGVDGVRFLYRPKSPDFLDGLTVGLMWRDLFYFKSINLAWYDGEDEYEYNIEQFLSMFSILARYDMAGLIQRPLVVSFGYANRGYKGLHLGARYDITEAVFVTGDVMAGGLLDPKKFGFVSFGVNPGYYAAPLYADLFLRFGTNYSDDKVQSGQGNFQIEPVVKYAVIPNTLLAKLGFAYTVGAGSNNLSSWSIVPGVYWNLKADEDTDTPLCGIRFFYNYGRNLYKGTKIYEVNDMSISFHWSF